MFRIVAILVTLAVFPSILAAQWVSDSTTNTPVCVLNTSTQTYPSACTDGSDGAIIVWQDTRNGGGFTVYAQRLASDGTPMWTKNGVRLARGSNAAQTYPVAASDGKGGAYVVWQDLRNSGNGIDLYAQHISSSGTILYDSVGRPISFAKGDQTNQQIVADGLGNAFVVWEDNRSDNTTTNPDIYMSRLTPTRVAWDTTGVLLSGEDSKQRAPQLCDDGHGGFMAAWETDQGIPSAIDAQRVDSNGTKLWGTSPYGITVFKLSNTQNSKNVCIRRDGTQAMLAWETANVSSSFGQDIYATRLTSTGINMYPAGIDITGGGFLGDQLRPQVFSDDSSEVSHPNGNAGLIVLFENVYSVQPEAIMMVRAFANGTSLAPTAGTGFYQVSSTSGPENGYQAVRVGPGSIMAVWNDRRSDSAIYAQRVDRTLVRGFHIAGTPATWGLPISHRVGTQAKQMALAPRTNGAIAAWTDYRNGTADIYAQLIFKDGTLPVELETFHGACHHTGEVELAWRTASEHGNAGFEIERRSVGSDIENGFSRISSYTTAPALRGAGNSELERTYGFIDRTASPAVYEYRLTEVAFDGTRTTHEPIRIDARSGESVNGWSVGTASPLPLNYQATVPISVPSDAIVDVSISDITGRTVTMPVQHEHWSVGSHEVAIRASQFSASGTYFLQMSAFDPSSGALIWHSAHPTSILAIK